MQIVFCVFMGAFGVDEVDQFLTVFEVDPGMALFFLDNGDVDHIDGHAVGDIGYDCFHGAYERKPPTSCRWRKRILESSSAVAQDNSITYRSYLLSRNNVLIFISLYRYKGIHTVKAIRTIKIKIKGSSKAPEVIKNYLQALNWVSPLIFNSKELNSNRIAKAYYPTLREKFQLPSQLACSLCKHIAATYNTAKSNKRWKLATFKNATIPVVWKRDFNKSRKGITLWGETISLYHPRIAPINTWKDSKLKQVNEKLYLILSYEKEVPEPIKQGCIVGVDSGIKRMLVASNSSNNKAFFFNGGKLNHLRKCIRQRRSKIQAVGTRSAHRLLQRLAHRERAITEHLLHVASKALTSYAVESNARVVVFEDLSNVREASLKKGQDLREKVCRWPYGSLQFKAGYKLAEKGVSTTVINPAYTSQTCPRCGHIARENRYGLQFQCVACGHMGDADLTASENIRSRYILREQGFRRMGSVNTQERSGYSFEMVLHNSTTCSMTQV